MPRRSRCAPGPRPAARSWRCCRSITAADDGHLPSPLVLASAIAARTERLAIMLAAVVLPFWDPVRLAEDMAVLDIISKGRVSYVFGIGHRPEEYDHFGVDMRRRGRLADEQLTQLRQLLEGKPVASDGREHPHHTGMRVRRRAVHHAGRRQPSRGQTGGEARAGPRPADEPAGLKELYENECRAHGHEPGSSQLPADNAPTAVFVADDVDKAWDELGPHLLHDAVTAASYRHGDEGVASISRADTT